MNPDPKNITVETEAQEPNVDEAFDKLIASIEGIKDQLDQPEPEETVMQDNCNVEVQANKPLN